MHFLVHMYYTHFSYQTSIFGKNCAYYIRIFTVLVYIGKDMQKEQQNIVNELSGVIVEIRNVKTKHP